MLFPRLRACLSWAVDPIKENVEITPIDCNQVTVPQLVQRALGLDKRDRIS